MRQRPGTELDWIEQRMIPGYTVGDERSGRRQEDLADNATVAYYLRLFVLGGLPLSEPDTSEVIRRAYGGALKLTFLSPREIGLPYGRAARLIVLWLTTQVVRTQQRVIRLGSSFHRFCGAIGTTAITGKRATTTSVMDQLIRLSKMSLHLDWVRPPARQEGGRGIYRSGHFKLTAETVYWWDVAKGAAAGPCYILLDEDFCQMVLNGPTPVDPQVIRALDSALAIDVYVFCTMRAYRLRRLRKPDTVSWAELEEQFGSGFSRSRDFRREMKKALEKVLRFYPEVRVKPSPTGLTFLPFATHIPSLDDSSTRP
ncbi:MAG TPA: replication protein RepA [Thermoanaerobaculia bacterium]|nr:replication protein RepA [Thermoanaerobaculia bacterium]